MTGSAPRRPLLEQKDQWHGTLMFIAQPAEETVSGAKAMLADGLFTRFKKPDFGFALHDGAFAYGNLTYPLRQHRIIQFRQPRDQVPRPWRSRRGTPQADHRSRDDGSALHRRRAKRDQPRERSDPSRRGQRSARSMAALLREHHSRRRAAARNHPHLQAGGARPKYLRGSSARPRPWPRCRTRPRPTSGLPKAPRP